jgi:hypothetical protein
MHALGCLAAMASLQKTIQTGKNPQKTSFLFIKKGKKVKGYALK